MVRFPRPKAIKVKNLVNYVETSNSPLGNLRPVTPVPELISEKQGFQ